MILRRIIEHVKAQNWFAVGLDFAIVVIGVFVGIQMSNWNDARQVKAEEKRLMVQLLAEVEPAIGATTQWLESTKNRVANFKSAIEVAQSGSRETHLSRSQCRAAALSHIVLFRGSSLPTLEEALSTGGLGVFANHKLRLALMRYQSHLAETRIIYEAIQGDFANLIDFHADAFSRKYLPDPDGAERKFSRNEATVSSAVDCQLDVMQADQTLQNRMISNLGRTQGLILQAEEGLALLQEVKTALENAQR